VKKVRYRFGMIKMKKMFEMNVPSTQLSKYNPRYFRPAFSVSMSLDGKYLATTVINVKVTKVSAMQKPGYDEESR